MNRPRHEWTSDEIKLMGTMSDQKVAKKIGVSPTTIYRTRKRKGIPAFVKFNYWTPEQIAVLKMPHQMPDRELARELGVSRDSLVGKRLSLGIRVRPRRKLTAEQVAMLGKMPDAQLAKRIGCSITVIFVNRWRLNIPTYTSWTEDKINLLGTVSDAAIGKQIGVSTQSVWRKRKSLGIPPYKRSAANSSP